MALFYIRDVKAGNVKDRRFIVTVSEAYNVDRTTVQKWWENRDRIWDGITAPINAAEVLEVAGKRYQHNRPDPVG